MFYSFVNEHKQAGWDAWQTAGDSSDGAQQRCCVELRVQESSCCGKHILLTVPWQPWSSRFTQYDREYFKNLSCCCWKTQRCLLQNVILCMLGKYGKPVDMVPASAGRIKSQGPCVQTSVWINSRNKLNITSVVQHAGSETNHHVEANTSSHLFLLQCAVRQLCEGELCNVMWHNSNVNHKAHCLLVVFGLSQWGACREGKGETGPCMDTKDVGVEQAPAGRDYCNLCHWLNGFPSPRGVPVSWWSTTTVEGPGKWMNTPWAAFWCRLMGLLVGKTLALAAPERYYLLCGSIGQGGFLKTVAGRVAWIEVYRKTDKAHERAESDGRLPPVHRVH